MRSDHPCGFDPSSGHDCPTLDCRAARRRQPQRAANLRGYSLPDTQRRARRSGVKRGLRIWQEKGAVRHVGQGVDGPGSSLPGKRASPIKSSGEPRIPSVVQQSQHAKPGRANLSHLHGVFGFAGGSASACRIRALDPIVPDDPRDVGPCDPNASSDRIWRSAGR